MNLEEFCRSLPKLELHAHLNGSLSTDTLRKLCKMQNPNSEDRESVLMSVKNFSSLGECFKVFDIAHSLTVTPEAVFQSTYDTIKEFKDDNVIYLELRSTPRAVQGKMTKEEYIEAILKAFESCKTDFPSILLKLLISINRKQGYKAAQENVQLAINYFKKYPQYVVGLDLSGDPMAGGTFLELVNKARMVGLKIAAHCAEISNETEAMDILEFKPDRLGHCTCVHPVLQGSNKLFSTLINSKIPVGKKAKIMETSRSTCTEIYCIFVSAIFYLELCLTSNVQCKTVPAYEAHQFQYLYEAGHPICLATDDKGVFHTSLSREYEIAGATFALGRDELIKLCRSSVNYAFATQEEKQMLLSEIENFNNKDYDIAN